MIPNLEQPVARVRLIRPASPASQNHISWTVCFVMVYLFNILQMMYFRESLMPSTWIEGHWFQPWLETLWNEDFSSSSCKKFLCFGNHAGSPFLVGGYCLCLFEYLNIWIFEYLNPAGSPFLVGGYCLWLSEKNIWRKKSKFECQSQKPCSNVPSLNMKNGKHFKCNTTTTNWKRVNNYISKFKVNKFGWNFSWLNNSG